MDWDRCNHKKIDQFQAEARRWKSNDGKSTVKSAGKKGLRTQPSKRKKRGN